MTDSRFKAITFYGKRYNTQHIYRYKSHEQLIKDYGGNDRNRKTLVILLITIFALLVGFSGSAIGETKESALKEAYMVIADGSKSKAKAEEKLEAYLKKGYPQHTGYEQTDKYPKLMLSDQIKGLNPGFWIVVAAISDDKEVAETLSQFIRSLGQASYVRQVWVERPEEVKLLILDFNKMLYECSETEYQIPGDEWCHWKNQITEISVQENFKGFRITQVCDNKRFACKSIEARIPIKSSYLRSQSTYYLKGLISILPYVYRSDFGDDLYFSPEPSKPSEYLDCGIIFPNQEGNHWRSSDFLPNQKILKFKKFTLLCFGR